MTPIVATRWDAGNKGCGQLVVGLQRVVAALQDGELLELHASDAGAPEDIPAWCRIMGHTLVSANHPVYVMRKKGDGNV